MAKGRNNKKRKKRGSSNSSNPESAEKKYKEELSKESLESEEDEVLIALNMADQLAPKLDEILSRLSGLDNKIEILDKKITIIDANHAKISRELKEELATFKSEMKSVKDDLVSRCSETEQKCKLLEDQILYHEVYQRRENLRIFGIKEDKDEDVERKVKYFMDKELDLYEVDQIEFQRVHRVGQIRGDSPRPIIIRFLRYPDRERVFNSAKKLKGTNFYIKPDLPREIVNRRKKQQYRLVNARKEGKRAFFSRPEPDKLYIDGTYIPL